MILQYQNARESKLWDILSSSQPEALRDLKEQDGFDNHELECTHRAISTLIEYTKIVDDAQRDLTSLQEMLSIARDLKLLESLKTELAEVATRFGLLNQSYLQDCTMLERVIGEIRDRFCHTPTFIQVQGQSTIQGPGRELVAIPRQLPAVLLAEAGLFSGRDATTALPSAGPFADSVGISAEPPV